MLGDIARGSGDLVDRTGTEAGDVIRSKKGDFVLTVDPAQTAGADLRIVVEAKDRAMSGRQMRDEIREAKTNRGAAVGLVVFTPAHAPSGIAPFDVRAGDVYCVVDPEAPDPAMLEAAVRLARLLAQVSLRDQEIEVDASAIKTALDGVREQLELIKGLKSTLTSIGTSSRDVAAGLDRLRDGVLARVARGRGGAPSGELIRNGVRHGPPHGSEAQMVCRLADPVLPSRSAQRVRSWRARCGGGRSSSAS